MAKPQGLRRPNENLKWTPIIQVVHACSQRTPLFWAPQKVKLGAEGFWVYNIRLALEPGFFLIQPTSRSFQYLPVNQIMAAITNPKPSAAAEPEKIQSTTELLTSLTTTGQELSKNLNKHASINPGFKYIATDLSSKVAIIAAVLESLHETCTCHALALLDEKASTQIVPILLRTVQTAFSNIEKALQTAIETENDEDWLDDNEAQTRRRHRQTSLVGALGSANERKVLSILEDTTESLAFLNNALKYLALGGIKKE